eukprot:scaffold4883_cov61-Cylindrotheca_fusiformis.AAC.2
MAYCIHTKPRHDMPSSFFHICLVGILLANVALEPSPLNKSGAIKPYCVAFIVPVFSQTDWNDAGWKNAGWKKFIQNSDKFGWHLMIYSDEPLCCKALTALL